jgi:class 3 adenylate cyclase
MGKSPTSALLSLFALLARLLGILSVAMALLFLLPLAVPYVHNATSYPYVKEALRLERTVSAEVRRMLPASIDRQYVTRWVMAGGMLILSWIFARLRYRLSNWAVYFDQKHALRRWQAKMKISDNASVLTPLKRTLEQLRSATTKQDREGLLRQFVETKRKLDAFGKDLAFLSIDVVDSTGMKEGEEKAIVEHAFREYKHFVDRTFTAHGVLKAAWTPDGVMACFTSVDAAVKAGREVITGLDDFNKNVNSMRRGFVVRCGVNSGYVYFDDSVPLEEVSDRVIDIAGHMQKHARPNTVCVAKPSIVPLNNTLGFQPTDRVIDGYEVYEWQK